MLRSTYQIILYERTGGTVWIRFNRPDALNAFSPLLISEFCAAIDYVQKNEKDVRALVTTGVGRAYSAGVDLKALSESVKGGQFTAGDNMLQKGREAIDVMQSFPFPTIAMVNGHCYTGAMELMLAHDLIFASDDCKIADTHAKWGIAPKWGMSQRLPLRVGLHKAMEMSFSCKAIDGKEAMRIGLVNASVPGGELDAYVKERVAEIEKNSGQTISLMKRLYYYGGQRTVIDGLEKEWHDETKLTDKGSRVDFKKDKSKL